MTTNMAKDSSSTTSIDLHAWYSGSTAATKCKFFMNGSSTEFATDEISGGSTNWTTDSVTANNLSPSTQYSFLAKFYDANGNLLATTSTFNFSTDTPVKLNTPTYYGTSNVTTSAITVDYLNNVANADYYDINCYTSAGTLVDTQHTTDGTATFTGLSCGTGYKFKCQATSDYQNYYSDSDWSAYSTITYTENGTLGTLSVESYTATPTTISFTVTNLGTGVRYYLDYYKDVSGSWELVGSADHTSNIFNLSSLEENTDYKLVCYAYKSGYDDSNTVTSYISTPSGRPAYFDWTYAGCDINGTPVNSSDGTKSNSYYLYTYSGNISNPIEWYGLIINVQDMYTYKGYESSTPTMNHVSPKTNMLASQYNQVKNAIVWLYNQTFPSNPISISDLSDTDPITTNNFNILREKINLIS